MTGDATTSEAEASEAMPGGAPATVIVVRSGPGTAGARRGLSMAAELGRRGGAASTDAPGGRPATLALLGDGVLLAQEAARTGAQVVCLADDVALRGFAPGDLGAASVVGYGELVELLVGAANVIGAL